MQEDSQKESLKLRGFVRVVTVDRETGLVTEDTGVIQNKITTAGYLSMFGAVLLGSTGISAQSCPNYLAFGSNTTPISSTFTNFMTTGTALGFTGANIVTRQQIAYFTDSEGGRLRIVASWAGTAFVKAASTASFNALGLFHTNTGSYSALAAATFPQVNWRVGNDCWITYDLKVGQT